MKKALSLLLALCLLSSLAIPAPGGRAFGGQAVGQSGMARKFDEFYRTYPTIQEGSGMYYPQVNRELLW